MKLEVAEHLLNILSCNISKKTVNGDVVDKLLIVPSNTAKLNEYLRLYKSNKCNDGGMIKDCYSSDDLTVIFIFQGNHQVLRFQNMRQFLLKKKEILSFN